MNNWFEQARANTEPILQAIKQHPFIVQLIAGTLPQNVFRFYLNQDSLYLASYKKSLAQVACRCEETAHTQFYLESATGVLAVEEALHQQFLAGVSLCSEPTPTCELYTRYLSSVVQQQTVEEALAATLPCFTIYKEIGDYIIEQSQVTEGGGKGGIGGIGDKGSKGGISSVSTSSSTNPYQSWIDTYGGEAFALATQQAIDITNHYAAQASPSRLKAMQECFTKASKLEWMFWDSAYQLETWKL